MGKTSGKKRIKWEIPLLVRLSDSELTTSGLCDDGSGDLGDCKYGYLAMGVCDAGQDAKVT